MIEQSTHHQANQTQWKNKHADGPISAKKPKKVKERQRKKVSDRTTPGVDEDISTEGHLGHESELLVDDPDQPDQGTAKLTTSIA